MYSVLIVDDEEPVLESYSYLVETGLDDFNVCATARSGGEALQAAHQHRPDVVLMDIAMPGIDGLDTIRELQHEFTDALYILSTAYERFDLAQRAIPLRVFAYLVKPVSRKRFLETMFLAKAELDERRASLSRRIEHARIDAESLAREARSFLSLITWKPLNPTEWERYRNLFELTSDYGVVAAVRCTGGDLCPEIAERVERRFRCLWTETAQRMVVFIAEATPRETIEEALREIASSLSSVDESVAIGVGDRHRYDGFFRSYDEALRAIPPVAGVERHLRELRRKARDFAGRLAAARTPEGVSDAYTVLADDVFATWRFPLARYRIAAILESLLLRLDAESGSPDISLSIGDPLEEISAMETRREVDTFALRTIRLIVAERTRFSETHWPESLQIAVRFIDEHYAEPLQLSTVAEHCGVSTGHMSRLFSEHLGSRFSDYLNSVRLDVARRLLTDGSRSIKETSYAVGYHDPNYFSRIFKKYTGRSPSSYLEEAGDE